MTRAAPSLVLLALLVAACAGPAADVPPPAPPAAASPPAAPSPVAQPPAVQPPSAPAAAARLTVYKSLGRKQCEAGGETPETLAAQLKAAGVEAMPVGCADDGRMYAAMCGGGDGWLGLVDIPAADAAAAAKAGFRPFSDLREASRQPCPGSPGATSKK